MFFILSKTFCIFATKTLAKQMAEYSKWQWQEPGTAWKGVGVYHVTLTVPSREPLFGTLVIPDEPAAFGDQASEAWLLPCAEGYGDCWAAV